VGWSGELRSSREKPLVLLKNPNNDYRVPSMAVFVAWN